jgi:hypothetical protein
MWAGLAARVESEDTFDYGREPARHVHGAGASPNDACGGQKETELHAERGRHSGRVSGELDRTRGAVDPRNSETVVARKPANSRHVLGRRAMLLEQLISGEVAALASWLGTQRDHLTA